jgi:phosphoglucosamine mutase
VSLRFGTDGVRGVANTELTPDYVVALGRAAARVLGGGRIVVGRDTRRSGPLIEAALVAGLAAEGVDVELLGVVPTPAVAMVAAAEGVPAAVITASHNPFADNGVKLFAAGGTKLSDEVETGIEREIHALGATTRTGAAVGSVTARDDALGRYVEHIVASFPDGLAGRRIVVDAANGAMSAAAPAVLRALDADVIVTHAEPDGQNINAGCGATAPAALSASVLEHGAALGLALDGDGDRLIAVDHRGRLVDGDRIIALCALDLRAHHRLAKNTVVVTVMSNLGFHRAMAREGIDVVATQVGDRYVLEALGAGGYSLGGEQSGHIIFTEHATTGDGLLAGLVLLDLVERSERSLAELSDDVMTVYPQVLLNVGVAERHPDIAELLEAELAAAQSALGEEGRVLVRPSGTEPLVRVMVEAASNDLANAVAQRLAGVVTARFGAP